jgi:hypothetical protein
MSFTCSKCTKTLKSKRTLANHLKTCDGLLSTQCERCHKNFANKVSKSRHKKNEICKKNGTMISLRPDTSTIIVHPELPTHKNDISVEDNITRQLAKQHKVTMYFYK